MILIYILIVLFVCLIGYQIFLAISPKSMIEGMENEDTKTTETSDATEATGTTDPNFIPYEGGNSADKALSLATQNQYNIEYLNKKIKDVDKVKDDIAKMKLDIDNQQQQLGDISTQMSDVGNNITNGATQEDAMNITGLEEDDPTAVAEENIAADDNVQP
jgi:hypothetical protein